MHALLDGTVPNGGEGTPVDGASLNQFPIKTVYAWGEFDGASVAIEHSPDGLEWFPVKFEDDSPLVFTAKDSQNVVLPASWLRAVVTDDGDDTAVHCAIG